MRHALLSVLAAALVTGCSATPVTTLEVSWVTPQPPKLASFKELLLITVASDEFVQIAFQKQMAEQLKAHGINAVASGRYFTRYTDSERARFMRSIDESHADFVLLARVTNKDEKIVEDRGMIIGPTGMPYSDATGIQGAYARYVYPSSFVAAADGEVTTITAEASIFTAKGEKLIWSARTRSTNSRQLIGEDAAAQYIKVILEAMKKDKLL